MHSYNVPLQYSSTYVHIIIHTISLSVLKDLIYAQVATYVHGGYSQLANNLDKNSMKYILLSAYITRIIVINC